MKSIVAFVDLTHNTTEFLERISKHLSMGDALYFVHELPSIDGALLPLIGDLKDIRKEKLNKQLHRIKEEMDTPLCKFETIIFEDNLIMNGELETLNKGEVILADQTQNIPHLDKKRFLKWIDQINQPVYILSPQDKLIPLK